MPENDIRTFRLFCIMLRELNGWTQVELAQRLGQGQPAISKLEAGTMKPTGSVILAAYRLDPLLFNIWYGNNSTDLLLASRGALLDRDN